MSILCQIGVNLTLSLIVSPPCICTFSVPPKGLQDRRSSGDKIGDIDNKNHLDIRYYPNQSPMALDINTKYPGWVLAGWNCDDLPILIDNSETVITDHYRLYVESDDCTLHKNPAGAKYFEFGVRVLDNELNLQNVKIYLSGYDRYGSEVHQDTLLDNSRTLDPKHIHWVDYKPYLKSDDSHTRIN